MSSNICTLIKIFNENVELKYTVTNEKLIITIMRFEELAFLVHFH